MKKNEFDFTKNFTARAEILDLERRGWNFDDLYNEVHEAYQGQYRAEHGEDDPGYDMNSAADYEQENYHVRIKVNADGTTEHYICQNQGSEEYYQGDTGDDKATIEDLIALHDSGDLWDCEQIDE